MSTFLLPVNLEHFGENPMILLRTVAKWRCIKLCAIFFWTTLYSQVGPKRTITDDFRESSAW